MDNKIQYKPKKIQVGKVDRYLIVFALPGDLIQKYSYANKYICLFTNRKRRNNYNGVDYIRDVTSFLNFLVTKGINPEEYLSSVTIDDVNEFMLAYCSRLGRNGDYIGNGSRIRMQRNLARFLINVRDAGINPELKDHYIRDENRCEIILVKNDSNNNKQVIRYCPEYFVKCFLKWARILKPNCWIASVFCYFAGLRPAEACNLTHPNSIYGGNVHCIYINNQIAGIEIDLSKEYWNKPLRGDGVEVGRIKRPRPQVVVPQNVGVLYSAYQEYLELTRDMIREEYGPLILQSRKSSIYKAHMAYRYLNFYQDFKMICEKYVWPELITMGGEPEYYAKQMIQNKYGMHMFRHGFSAKLAAEEEQWNRIQEARGDSPNNPDTAAMYVLKGGGLQAIVDDVSRVVEQEIKKKGKKGLHSIPKNI